MGDNGEILVSNCASVCRGQLYLKEVVIRQRLVLLPVGGCDVAAFSLKQRCVEMCIFAI